MPRGGWRTNLTRGSSRAHAERSCGLSSVEPSSTASTSESWTSGHESEVIHSGKYGAASRTGRRTENRRGHFSPRPHPPRRHLPLGPPPRRRLPLGPLPRHRRPPPATPPSTSARYRPVALSGTETSASGRPSPPPVHPGRPHPAHVDHPIGGFDHLQVVLDHEHGVSASTRRSTPEGASLYPRPRGRSWARPRCRVYGPFFPETRANSRAILSRCASPPDRVGAGCPSLR